MTTIRKEVRDDDLEKDTYGRYVCTNCGTKLTRVERHGEAGQIHRCPDCGREWERLQWGPPDIRGFLSAVRVPGFVTPTVARPS